MLDVRRVSSGSAGRRRLLCLAVGGLLLAPAWTGGAPATAADGEVRPVAGNGDYHWSPDGRMARTTGLSTVRGVAVDPQGQVVFADADSRRVRTIDDQGRLQTLAGRTGGGGPTEDGPAREVSLGRPEGLAFGPDGALYIADSSAARVRRLAGGVLTTVAGGGDQLGDGGPATAARLQQPTDLTVAPDGTLYVADSADHRVRRIAPDGTITTVVGDGQYGWSPDGTDATAARLGHPAGVALDREGALLVSDSANAAVRRITGGVVTTLAGTGRHGFSGDGGRADRARLAHPTDLAVDGAGQVFVSDAGNYRLRAVATDGSISTVAGTGQWGSSGDGGPAREARFTYDPALAVGGRDLLVADPYAYRVRVVSGVAQTRPVLQLPGTPPVPDVPTPPTGATVFGGPVVLAGIDAEDGGVGGHGPIENYVTLVDSVLREVRNGRSGLLVLGAGREDYCTGAFWTAVAERLAIDVSFAEGPEQIRDQRLSDAAVLAVAGSAPETCGGLDEIENQALSARRDEVAAFVNGGGGLVGFTQVDHSEPYGYVSGLGTFDMGYYSTDAIDPTPDGERVGISDALDVCCWHNSFLSYPDYLTVLATYDDGSVAALGGAKAVLCKEDGLQAVDGTPVEGTASRRVHEDVEPVVSGVDGGLGKVVHGVNCDFVVPVEDEVDRVLAGTDLVR